MIIGIFPLEIQVGIRTNRSEMWLDQKIFIQSSCSWWVIFHALPCLKLTFSHLKMDGWFIRWSFLLGVWDGPTFRCYVSFREGSSNPSCRLVEEDGLQHRAMVLACALAEAEDVGKMVVKKVKARGGMGWDGMGVTSGFWDLNSLKEIVKIWDQKLLICSFRRAAGREESTATAHSVAAKSFTALFIPMNEEGFLLFHPFEHPFNLFSHRWQVLPSKNFSFKPLPVEKKHKIYIGWNQRSRFRGINVGSPAFLSAIFESQVVKAISRKSIFESTLMESYSLALQLQAAQEPCGGKDAKKSVGGEAFAFHRSGQCSANGATWTVHPCGSYCYSILPGKFSGDSEGTLDAFHPSSRPACRLAVRVVP